MFGDLEVAWGKSVVGSICGSCIVCVYLCLLLGGMVI